VSVKHFDFDASGEFVYDLAQITVVSAMPFARIWNWIVV
jgi:hypothetical protein